GCAAGETLPNVPPQQFTQRPAGYVRCSIDKLLIEVGDSVNHCGAYPLAAVETTVAAPPYHASRSPIDPAVEITRPGVDVTQREDQEPQFLRVVVEGVARGDGIGCEVGVREHHPARMPRGARGVEDGRQAFGTRQ